MTRTKWEIIVVLLLSYGMSALYSGTTADYNTGNSPQFGLTIGRYANRIASTRITIGTDSFSPFFRPFIAMSCSPRWRSPISELGHC